MHNKRTILACFLFSECIYVIPIGKLLIGWNFCSPDLSLSKELLAYREGDFIPLTSVVSDRNNLCLKS